MGFTDRLRGWFKGEGKRSAPSKSTGPASRASTRELEAFASTRGSVEAYLEPRTAIYSTTLLMVADDGEYLRRPIGDRDQAVELCAKLNLPLYDAARVGYPKRMRDYDAGVRPNRLRVEDLPPWPDGDVGADGPPPPPTPPADEPPGSSDGPPPAGGPA
ncbi:MAG: hypothetical protein WEB03_16505 [Nitriliruptor sp.]|uniref:hypothetical protein n=1 Tax=Nitriliruptor sp. TaxID=2448056 RepID=UPI0034A03C48